MTTISISALPAKTGTINDAAYLHLNESSLDKKVSIIQLLAKISDQYTTDIVTFLGSADSAAARASLGIDRRTTVSDANYTILATDKVVAQNGTMSAARIFTLPAASTVQAGAEIIVIDESGSVDSTNKITVQRNGTDTIDGSTSIEILQAYGFLKLICDGSNSWKIANRLIATQTEVNTGTNTNKVITPATLAGSTGKILQIQENSTSIFGSTTTTIPIDNSIPQNTEGADSGVSITFTPKSSTSTLYFFCNASVDCNGSLYRLLTLCDTSVSNCLASSIAHSNSGGRPQNLSITYKTASGSTSARTYQIRYGANGGTAFINGTQSGAIFGGSLQTRLTIIEIEN